MSRHTKDATIVIAASFLLGCGMEPAVIDGGEDETGYSAKSDRVTNDGELREKLRQYDVTPVDPGVVLPMDHPKVVLGQLLFFDKALSGNQDISCATCHHPGLGTSDGLSLPVGVGGSGVGPLRKPEKPHGFIPRNSPDLFNRGAPEWTTMFWDGRVSAAAQYFDSPAGENLLNGLDSVLAVQAMFPPTSAHEMRGEPEQNPIAAMTELPEIWAALTERIVGFVGYQEMLQAAYPDVALEDVTFAHIANALAAFEVAAFTRLNSPFDQYLAGHDDAMNEQEKRGADLFFGDAGCATCHSGSLLTDQKSHVIGTPQLGPGKGDSAPQDEGRFLETNDDADKYAFRTPPLRNVELTGPYMHSGSYTTLYDAVMHHLKPVEKMQSYNAADLLRPDVAETWFNEEAYMADCIERLDPQLTTVREITPAEVEDIVAFLLALTDPSSRDMSDLIPAAVMSGLPVDILESADY